MCTREGSSSGYTRSAATCRGLAVGIRLLPPPGIDRAAVFLKVEERPVIDQAQLLAWRDEFLKELESWLDPRDPNYDLGDVVQSPTGHPNIFHDFSKKAIDIRLTEYALTGAQGGLLAKWQIAHECVHLIDPNFSPPTNVLEEGIATWYQNRKIYPARIGSTPLYLAAEALVSQYLDSGYLQVKIREMRRRGLRIGRFTVDELVQNAPVIDKVTAFRLAESFDPLHGQ